MHFYLNLISLCCSIISAPLRNLFDYNIRMENSLAICRPVSMDDFEGYAGIALDESIWRYTTTRIQAEKDIVNYLEEKTHLLRIGNRYAFTIISKADNHVAGSTSFGNISLNDRRVEIGWTWLARKYQRTGLNRAVKFLMLKCAFEYFDFERVEFKTDVMNQQSRKALIKIGAVEEGTLRSHTLMPGARRRDTLYFSILRHEWDQLLKSRFKEFDGEQYQINLKKNGNSSTH